MKQSPILAFESSVFPDAPDGNGKTKPPIQGRDLANWLADQLRQAGVQAQKVIPEEFGWCVHVKTESQQSLYVVCAGSPEGPNQWKVFAFVEEGVLSKLTGKDNAADPLGSLFGIVKQCLADDPTIENLQQEE